jgi:formylglycine-generating enzyme required for sulfatase activity
VINVSWNDAKAYVAWLSRQTGKPYRLLSEAEWEYACRAGTTTRFSWGDDWPTPEQANFGRKVGKTTKIGSYPPNSWGLYDMPGNVWEWVEDCWNDSYQGAPCDGSAWTGGDGSRRMVRGGSWFSPPGELRSASRANWGAGERLVGLGGLGFRVARTCSAERGACPLTKAKTSAFLRLLPLSALHNGRYGTGSGRSGGRWGSLPRPGS